MTTHNNFNIADAIRSAFRLCRREWRYIGLIAQPLIMAELLTVALLRTVRPDAPFIEAAIWALPATALSGWFMCLLARLAVLGERVDRLPRTAEEAPDRVADLRAGVMIWILVSMVATLLAAYVLYWGHITHAVQEGTAVSQTLYTAVSFGGMFLFVFLFWSARFLVLHLLAAVGYPLRLYIRRGNGFATSACFIGLALAIVLPALLVFHPVATLLAAAGKNPVATVATIITTTIYATAVKALVTTAAVFALKDMLGARRGATPA